MYIYIIDLSVFYMKNLCTSLHIDLLLMTILMLLLLRYPRNMTNISKKMSNHSKKQKSFFSLVYNRCMSKILVCGCYMTVLEYNQYVKVTKMTKMKNSGIQTIIYENLVFGRYKRKKPCKVVYHHFSMMNREGVDIDHKRRMCITEILKLTQI